MSQLALDAAFGGHPGSQRVAFKRVMARRENRVGDSTEVERLSLSSGGYLYPREGVTDRQQASELTEQRSLRVRINDLVINPMWLTGGSVAVSSCEGAVSPDYRVFEPSDEVEPRFLHHLLRSTPYRDQYNLFVRANTTFDRRIQQVDLDAMALWLPPRQEQRRIADFLDDRVARIDQIITARSRQAELASARRDAIADAVFAGDTVSGGAWLRLAAGCSFFTDGDWIESPYITSSGIRLVQTGNVSIGEFREQGFRYISEETFHALNCTAVLPGDVLVSRLASPVGRACICPDLGPAIASVDVAIARPQPWLLPEYIVEFFSTPKHLSDTDELARGSTMQRISRSQLGSIKIPVPDLAVQQSVVSRLGQLRREVQESRRQLRDSVRLLSEFKQSLVTAAVSGELDVSTAGSRIPG